LAGLGAASWPLEAGAATPGAGAVAGEDAEARRRQEGLMSTGLAAARKALTSAGLATARMMEQ